MWPYSLCDSLLPTSTRHAPNSRKMGFGPHVCPRTTHHLLYRRTNRYRSYCRFVHVSQLAHLGLGRNNAWDSVCCAPSIKWLILWATGYKRRQAIRAFNGQEGSTALSTVASRAGGSQASRAGQSPSGMGYDDNDGESKGESMDSFAVVVKHEVSVDVEGGSTRSLNGRAESRDGLNIGGNREHRGVWTETAKPERSFLHL